MPLDGTDREARKVVIVCSSGRSARTYRGARFASIDAPSVKTHEAQVRTSVVHARHFSSLTTDQGTTGLNAAISYTLDNPCSCMDVELVAGEVIQEVQRFSALHEEVVYRHCNEIDPCSMYAMRHHNLTAIAGMRLTDKVVNAYFHCYPELRANAIRSTDQNRVLVARRLEVEDAAKASDLCVRARSAGCTDERFNGFNKGVSGVDGDACLCVGQALGLFGLHRQCSWHRGEVVSVITRDASGRLTYGQCLAGTPCPQKRYWRRLHMQHLERPVMWVRRPQRTPPFRRR